MSSQAISREIKDHVAAVYDRTVYAWKVLEVDDSDVYITFYQHSGNITGLTVFLMPKRNDELWIPLKTGRLGKVGLGEGACDSPA